MTEYPNTPEEVAAALDDIEDEFGEFSYSIYSVKFPGSITTKHNEFKKGPYLPQGESQMAVEVWAWSDSAEGAISMVKKNAEVLARPIALTIEEKDEHGDGHRLNKSAWLTPLRISCLMKNGSSTKGQARTEPEHIPNNPLANVIINAIQAEPAAYAIVIWCDMRLTPRTTDKHFEDYLSDRVFKVD